MCLMQNRWWHFLSLSVNSSSEEKNLVHLALSKILVLAKNKSMFFIEKYRTQVVPTFTSFPFPANGTRTVEAWAWNCTLSLILARIRQTWIPLWIIMRRKCQRKLSGHQHYLCKQKNAYEKHWFSYICPWARQNLIETFEACNFLKDGRICRYGVLNTCHATCMFTDFLSLHQELGTTLLFYEDGWVNALLIKSRRLGGDTCRWRYSGRVLSADSLWSLAIGLDQSALPCNHETSARFDFQILLLRTSSLFSSVKLSSHALYNY